MKSKCCLFLYYSILCLGIASGIALGISVLSYSYLVGYVPFGSILVDYSPIALTFSVIATALFAIMNCLMFMLSHFQKQHPSVMRRFKRLFYIYVLILLGILVVFSAIDLCGRVYLTELGFRHMYGNSLYKELSNEDIKIWAEELGAGYVGGMPDKEEWPPLFQKYDVQAVYVSQDKRTITLRWGGTMHVPAVFVILTLADRPDQFVAAQVGDLTRIDEYVYFYCPWSE